MASFSKGRYSNDYNEIELSLASIEVLDSKITQIGVNGMPTDASYY